MPEVRMKTQYAGPSGSVNAGKVGKFSDVEAEALVSGGYGEYETAAVEIPEKRADDSPAEDPDASGDGPESEASEAESEKSGADELEKKGFVAAVKKAAGRKSKKK